jgi:hypothetical protein
MSEPPESRAVELLKRSEALADGSLVESVDEPAQIIEPEIDEGSVDSPGRLPGGPVFSPEEHLAKATKLLAMLLFVALFCAFIAHTVLIACFTHDKPNSVEEVSRVFNTWIPVFSGLFGSAATFYFTQGRK